VLDIILAAFVVYVYVTSNLDAAAIKLFASFSKTSHVDFLTRNYLYICVHTGIIYKSFISGVFRSITKIHDNHRTDVAEKAGDGGCALHLF